MDKIGILTFQNAYNYGAVLQAYALKTVIGNRAEIINYDNEYFNILDNLIKSEEKISRKIIKSIFIQKLRRKKNNFINFRNEFLVENQTLIKENDLVTLNDKYNTFITGSDQVWNLECSGGETCYFLDFVKDSKKKNSYAASFGVENLDDKYLDLYRKYLNDFNNISVREKSGQKNIEDLIGKNVPVVLDPTMLLSKDKWNELSGKCKNYNIKGKYILIYTVLNGNKIVEFAKNMAKDLDMEVYYITTSLRPFFGVKCIRDAGPIEWLNLIKNAEIVITNSFHGLAFSIINNKQFYIELLPPPAKTNARINELLLEFNLKNRLIEDYEESKNELIDYNSINNILKHKQEQSINYLNKIVDFK